MDQANLTIQADNSQGQKKDATVPASPGDGVANGSDSSGSPLRERDESHAPPPPPLHKKLLEIAEAGRNDEAAISAEFNTILLKNLSDIDRKDSDGKTALHVAIEHGLKAEARTLIQNKADIGLSDNEGQQPLYLACKNGSTELVTLLLNKSAIVDAASNGGETPLAAACRKGHTQIANILLDNKANTRTFDKENWTPLHLASLTNLEEIVKRLVHEDMSIINVVETNAKWTPLNLATYFGCKDAVSILLDNNADLYIKDDSGWTPLMTATRMHYPDIVRKILGHGAGWKEGYLEIRDDENNTPLHIASKEGLDEIVSQLIDFGADCNATDSQGMTPLHLASFHNYFESVSLLLSEVPVPAVDVGAMDNNGRTSLHLASLRRNEPIVKALLKSKAFVDALDNRGMTPLHLASGTRAERECLSDSELAISGQIGNGDPELERQNSESTSRQYLFVIELLLQFHANPCIKAATDDAATALHLAAAIGDKKRIDVLLNYMRKEDLFWEDWKDSPVLAALRGDDPPTAMESLLAKQEIKEAPFWKHDGRFQVIKEVLENVKTRSIISSIIREVPRDAEKLPEGFESWCVIEWAAHERLPEELSVLIDMSGTDEMVHAALRTTCQSINVKELESETSCERLIQIMVILITNSAGTTENIDTVKKASDLVKKHYTSLEEGVEKPGKKFKLRREERLIFSTRSERRTPAMLIDLVAEGNDRLEDTQQQSRSHIVHSPRGSGSRGMKGLQTDTAKAGKGLGSFSRLQDILKDPPFDQTSRTYKDKQDYRLPVSGFNHKDIIEKAEATVVAFFKGEGESGTIRRNRTVKNVVYGPGPIEVVRNAVWD
ncbi:NACHT ankyrin domain-containing protein [Fusarium globosum]|uniref:protein S-acyltransferase n=1 Tax=Fusarium globosum TaxID=78864 RepID=A0A8H5XR12_9HYPO|nr:NACHT ankyrin domain-containing protein [Fusarium globosum]